MSSAMNKKKLLFLNLTESGQRLKSIRKRLDRTLKQMSSLSGIPFTNISEMESGKKKPHQDYLAMLIQAFNVNANWVLTGKGQMFLQGYEIDDSFGTDTQRIADMLYLMNKSEPLRLKILADVSRIKTENLELVKSVMPEEKEGK